MCVEFGEEDHIGGGHIGVFYPWRRMSLREWYDYGFRVLEIEVSDDAKVRKASSHFGEWELCVILI